MDKEKLRQERKRAFREWFEGWYKKSEEFEGIEDKIRERNLAGYTNIEFKIEYTEDQPSIRLDSFLFLESLKEKLPGMKIYRRYFPKLGCPMVAGGIEISIEWD